MGRSSKKNTKPEAKYIAVQLRVLGYKQKDGTWAAHCLETDLVGYGDTVEAALDELAELTLMQVSFAHFKGQPALLDRPAPLHIIETYNSVMRSELQSWSTSPSRVDPDRRITGIELPRIPLKTDFAIAPM